jgi:hypothetical protein
MTKEYTIRHQHDGSQLRQRAPFDSVELCCHRRGRGYETLPAVEANSSFARNHRRQRNMTWNRTRSRFWRLAIALSMIAVMAEGYNETVSVNLDLEEEFFYAVESSDQSFGNSSHLEKDRSLQFQFPEIPIPPPIIIPTLQPFSFPPVPPIIIQFGKSYRMRKF